MRARGAAGRVQVTLAEWHNHPLSDRSAMRPAAKLVRADAPDGGLRIGPITEEVRRKLKLSPMQGGAQVNDVLMNSVAADSGLCAGDVIVQVQMQPIDSPADFRGKLDEARQSKRPYIVVLVQREDGFRWITVANRLSEG